MKSKALLFISLFLLSLMILVPLETNWFNTKTLDAQSNIDFVLDMYFEVLKTEPSRIGAKRLDSLIRERIQCYSDNSKFGERAHECNSSYVAEIIDLAQEEIQAMPTLGVFISHVQLCPITYSICIGDQKTEGECALLERQCIDMYLDRYWRGDVPSSSEFIS